MSENIQQTIGVIGGGSWGTALAQILASQNRDTVLWAREDEVVEGVNSRNENGLFLPGVKLDSKLKASSDLKEVAGRDVLLVVTPAQFLRATLEDIKNEAADKPVVICAKGIEMETGLLMSQVAKEVVPKAKIAILTGPTFAREIAQGKPSAVTIASKNKEAKEILREVMGLRHFRPYFTSDVIGAQLGGAIKNVIAIACGIVIGRDLGESARAALLTRGVAEIARLGVAMDAKKETLLGMCGIGDLMLTASSMQSRNYSLGMALGQGQDLNAILGERNAVTEGVYTAGSTLDLAKRHAVDMPISSAVHKCLKGLLSIDEAIEDMLNRQFRY